MSGDSALKPKLVDVPGLGIAIREHFEIKHSSYDVDSRQFGVHHNEELVDTSCNESAVERFTSEGYSVDPSDDTYITCDASKTGVTCTIRIDSEANPLFYSGKVTTTLHYDASTKKWSATGEKVEDEKTLEYTYCSPFSALNNLIANIRCYRQSSERTDDATILWSLGAIAASLSSQKDQVAAGMHLYSQGDCEKYNPGAEMPTGATE